MPLVSMTSLLADAVSGGYAVCYCESWNMESLQAIVEAAEEQRSPIIVGYNGGFLTSPERGKPAKLAFYGCMSTALRCATVPVAFILNETDSLAQIKEGIAQGFNAVMVENQRLRLEEYRGLVKQVVDFARAQGVSVEAQIGHLPDGAGHLAGEATDPATAQAFVEETGVDALAVAVGNVHILTKGKAPLDLELLARIHDTVKIPLVLHGGTGIPLETAKDCIRLGVAKVNFGTALKQAFLEAVRERLGAYRPPMSPHPFLGMGGKQDVLSAGCDAVKQKVMELIQAFGSVEKA